MDNPFIGLDAETRDQLKELLKTLSSERALQIILVLSKSDDIPDFPGGSMFRIINSLRHLGQLPDETQVLPGHGEYTSIGEELAHNPYMDR
jgi:ABC-type uncharacterized transport system ATPase subunit